MNGMPNLLVELQHRYHSSRDRRKDKRGRHTPENLFEREVKKIHLACLKGIRKAADQKSNAYSHELQGKFSHCNDRTEWVRLCRIARVVADRIREERGIQVRVIEHQPGDASRTRFYRTLISLSFRPYAETKEDSNVISLAEAAE